MVSMQIGSAVYVSVICVLFMGKKYLIQCKAPIHGTLGGRLVKRSLEDPLIDLSACREGLAREEGSPLALR